MATTIQYPGDVNIVVGGTLSARNITYPVNQITDAAIKAAANIDATKLIHQHAIRYAVAGGTTVAAVSVPVHTFRSAADIVAVEVVPITAPTGGDLAYSVDVQLGNQSTAFATILTAEIDIDSTVSDREVVSGTLSTVAGADGDTLQVVIATSGSTGTQGSGCLVTIWVREQP